jgi:hypothetical protein
VENDILSIDVRMELLIRQIEDLPKAIASVEGVMVDLTTLDLLREGLEPILDQARTIQRRLQQS